MSPDAELDLALGRKAGVALDHPVCTSMAQRNGLNDTAMSSPGPSRRSQRPNTMSDIEGQTDVTRTLHFGSD
jgi:hypothetical protein